MAEKMMEAYPARFLASRTLLKSTALAASEHAPSRVLSSCREPSHAASAGALFCDGRKRPSAAAAPLNLLVLAFRVRDSVASNSASWSPPDERCSTYSPSLSDMARGYYYKDRGL